jgi:hypothetical protein
MEKNKDSTSNQFLTKDIFLAAYLIAHQKKLIAVKPQNGIFWFGFENHQSCEQMVIGYWNGSGRVSARDFVNAYRNLKDIVFGRRPCNSDRQSKSGGSNP